MKGSPPRGRGKACFKGSQPAALRITPAWAGKRAPAGNRRQTAQDHPRVGGEKRLDDVVDHVYKGSPPRGRGKGFGQLNRFATMGITPAWAGKSFVLRLTFVVFRDHPRVGGEKRPIGFCPARARGSPPRGRGKVRRTDRGRVYPGITPAWAGKRLKRSHRSGIFISGPIPFHSVLHRPAGSGGSRAGRDGSPAGQPQNTGPA